MLDVAACSAAKASFTAVNTEARNTGDATSGALAGIEELTGTFAKEEATLDASNSVVEEVCSEGPAAKLLLVPLGVGMNQRAKICSE